jgi:fibronectin type III domain protein
VVNGNCHVRLAPARLLAAVLTGLLLQAPNSVLATRTITLGWLASPQPEVIGYTLHYGAVSGAYDHSISSSTTSATVSGLVEGKTYYFSVSSYTRRGEESLPSGEISYLVPPVPGGTYDGLFLEADGVRLNSAGAVTLLANARGTYTGRVQLGGRVHPFSGKLGENYGATNVVQRIGAPPLLVEMRLGTGDERDRMVGRISDGSWTAMVWADRAVFNSRTAPTPFAGAYTSVIPGADGNPAAVMGDGFGSVKIGADGVMQFSGALADGSKVTRSSAVSRAGTSPFYVSLYAGKGLAIGWFNFASLLENDLSGGFCWIKLPDASARFYPGGFARTISALGSRYYPPVGANPVLAFTHGLLGFSGGNLGGGFTNAVILGPKGVSNSQGPALSVKLTPAKGTFAGKVGDPATGKSWTFTGVVLQNGNVGYGYLVGTNQTSRVIFGPDP